MTEETPVERARRVGVPERLGGDPRNKWDDAFATFVDMDDSEFSGVSSSVLFGGGALQAEEAEGFKIAFTERLRLKREAQ